MRDGLAISLLTGKPVPGKARDRRRHQRVKVTLLGRYMLRDRREFPCQTIDMSPGGVLLFAPVKAEVGERVVVYLDQIGRVEGLVARHVENGFALSISVPVMKREKLADQLTWLANRSALGMANRGRKLGWVQHDGIEGLALREHPAQSVIDVCVKRLMA